MTYSYKLTSISLCDLQAGLTQLGLTKRNGGSKKLDIHTLRELLGSLQPGIFHILC